jgi:hypothetical protein
VVIRTILDAQHMLQDSSLQAETRERREGGKMGGSFWPSLVAPATQRPQVGELCKGQPWKLVAYGRPSMHLPDRQAELRQGCEPGEL